MIRWRDFWVAAVATVAVNLLFEVVAQGGLLAMGVAGIVAAINLIGREKLPNWYRLFAVGCVISFGAAVGLVGRTTEVGLSSQALIMACFFGGDVCGCAIVVLEFCLAG